MTQRNRVPAGGPKGRSAVRPYLFAYDVADPARLRRTRYCLQRWRVDGQYSVHETWMRPPEVAELIAELLGLVDRVEDRLLVARLTQRGGSPVRRLSGAMRPEVVQGRPLPRPGTSGSLRDDALHLLAYDVRDPARLQRVYRAASKLAIPVQKSMLFHRGPRAALKALEDAVLERVDRQVDDVRVYALGRLQDLWFVSGAKPALAEWAEDPGVEQGLVAWLARVGRGLGLWAR